VTTKPTESDVFVATTSGVCQMDGVEYTFFAGKTRVRAGHPLLRARRDYFEPDVYRIDYDWPPSRR
jgi:hypothetical protein